MPKIQNIETAYQKKHYWSYHEATQTSRQKHADKKALHKSTHIKKAFDKKKRTRQKGTRFLLVLMNYFFKSAMNQEIQYKTKERTTKAALQKCAGKKVR